MHSRRSIATTLVAASFGLATTILAGCATTDVEGSSEYLELRDERDALAAEVDDVRLELADLGDRLAEAETALGDAEATVDADQAAAGDFHQLLVLDVMNRVGLSPGDAGCVADAFVADAEVRGAYLQLIDPEQTDEAVMTAAYEQVTTVMEDCGLEIVREDPAAASAESRLLLLEALGEVEVTGDALPAFEEGVADPAVGMTVPVVAGADYTGTPVTIDPASDGPTMVIVMAHWCPHCNAEIPKLNQLRDEGRIPDGVNIVAVSSGVSPDRPNFPPADWLVDVDWTFPVVADGIDEAGSFIASGAYGTAGVPFVTMVDGNGVVTERWAGERDVDDLEAALEALAATG